MPDDSPFGPKSLKRKNVKNLKLGGGGDAPAPARSATPSLQDAQIPGGVANRELGGPDKLSDQLSTLEIGVEFKLDIRAEDLKVVSELGSGNGGTVSKVIHTATKTIMAKKVIHIDAKPAVRKQIVRELHIMHECHSPYIVSFYSAFLSEGDVVICMEYMDCGSLDTIAKKIGPIRIDVLGKIAEAVVEGLNYLYSVHHILHRDIKPSNIVVNSRGSIKLCDFGVSGELINSIADTFVGTSTYMSPERIKGAQYTVKSDVWSLGLTLLELAIGRFPFDADGSSAGTRASAGPMGILDLLQKIVNEPAPKLPKNPAFPTSLETMIDHCLIKDPEHRPSLADLLLEPFMRSAKATDVDLEGWACEILEKTTGQPQMHRARSSVTSILFAHQHQRESPAPPRPISRDSPIPLSRRPSASVEAERRPSQASSPYPTRTSSRPTPNPLGGHERSESGLSIDSPRQMPPPPPPSGKAGRPHLLQKAYTESASTTTMETSRENDKIDREREREKERAYAYRQGTIGIGFEGGMPSNGNGDMPRDIKSPGGSMPEMKEKRRIPPMATMTTSGNGLGLSNGDRSWRHERRE